MESYSYLVYGRGGVGSLESCSSEKDERWRQAELIAMGWQIIAICGTYDDARSTLKIYEEEYE